MSVHLFRFMTLSLRWHTTSHISIISPLIIIVMLSPFSGLNLFISLFLFLLCRLSCHFLTHLWLHLICIFLPSAFTFIYLHCNTDLLLFPPETSSFLPPLLLHLPLSFHTHFLLPSSPPISLSSINQRPETCCQSSLARSLPRHYSLLSFLQHFFRHIFVIVVFTPFVDVLL